MSQLEEFESTLKELVGAKRLSASKVTKLTEIALKSMEDDIQLVSILYRTHKSLSASAKVSSLYVFDALSRAARHQANKQNLTGDLDSAKGNSATFLLRIEGILDGLFQDMLSSENSELKEKAKKILDIWVKGNTFPAATLARLADLWKGKEMVKEHPGTVKSAMTVDPRTARQKSTTPPNMTAPAAPQTSSLPPTDPQSTLLALLVQAVNAGAVAAASSEQKPLATVSSPQEPEQKLPQLALLQQLAQTVNSTAPNTHSHPSSSSVATDLDRSQLAQYNPYGRPDRRDYGSPKSPKSGYRTNQPRDEPRGHRAEYHRDRSPPSRRRRSSRSKSPPGTRYPNRREYEDKHFQRQSTQTSGPASSDKDEFGRDIRPMSPETATAGSSQTQAAVVSTKPSDPRSNPHKQTASTEPAPNSTSLSPTGSSNVAGPSGTSASVSQTQYESGIDQFNIAMFDFTSPAAWETLGKMWEVSYGVAPTTEQLMQFVMTAGFGAAQGWYQHGWDSGMATGGDQGGTSGLTNGGGAANGNGAAAYSVASNNDTESESSGSLSSASRNSGGQMQKVGDKWMFVRSTGTEISS